MDFAIAYKHRDKDQEYEASKLESIQSMLKPIGSALGVQYKEGKSKKQDEASKTLPDDLPVEEVLKRLGGKNTMVKHHG